LYPKKIEHEGNSNYMTHIDINVQIHSWAASVTNKNKNGRNSRTKQRNTRYIN